MGEARDEEKVQVQIHVRASGSFVMEMTRAEFEERFPEDGEDMCELEEFVTNWDDVVNELDFEIEDANLIKEKKEKSRG